MALPKRMPLLAYVVGGICFLYMLSLGLRDGPRPQRRPAMETFVVLPCDEGVAKAVRTDLEARGVRPAQFAACEDPHPKRLGVRPSDITLFTSCDEWQALSQSNVLSKDYVQRVTLVLPRGPLPGAPTSSCAVDCAQRWFVR